MGERIAGKQDRPRLIIEAPPPPPQRPSNSQKYIIFLTFWPIYEKLVFNCFPLLYIGLHCDEVCICWHFSVPDIPGLYVRGLPFHNQGGVRVFTPEYNFFFLSQWKYNFFFLSEWKYNFFFITNPSIVLLYDWTRMILWFCECRVSIRVCLWLLA